MTKGYIFRTTGSSPTDTGSRAGNVDVPVGLRVRLRPLQVGVQLGEGALLIRFPQAVSTVKHRVALRVLKAAVGHQHV